MKALFIFAHPDDESFSSGGTIKKLSSAGYEVKLVTATRGEAGEVGNPAVTTRERLGEMREKELREAASILGIKEIFFLDYIDGTLDNQPMHKLNKQVSELLAKEKPDLVFTFDKHGGSNHPDHKTISKAVTLAFKKYKTRVDKRVSLYHTATPKSYLKIFKRVGLSYSAFGKVKGYSFDRITTEVDIKDYFETKIQAIKSHKTQHQDWERYLKRQEHVDLTKEYFILVSENFVS